VELDEHRLANQRNWDSRAPIHAASRTYDLDGFVADPQRLSGVVGFDKDWIGDVSGQRLLHLQCHIGTDTLSWARLGATVTGYDLSASSLDVARDLARRSGIDAQFVQGELYEAADLLGGERFDVVYTGVGALNWLPDIRGWARVVAALLAPGGTLLLREGHPMLWAVDHDRADDELVVATPYFETAEPMMWDEAETYTDNPGIPLEHTVQYEWNHGLGEILTAVLDEGLTIEKFAEHRELEWQPWHLWQRDQSSGRYVLPEHLRDRVPAMYTLVATKA
jgi:SAM-dependent methyltransferase